jgi:proteic killer suppression protein
MIKSFGSSDTEDIYHGRNSRDAAKLLPREIWRVAGRKLDMINAAHEIKDVLVPPGNRLEKLRGKLSGFHSIRINDQYRVIFIWSEGNADSVEIVDYH